MTRRLTCMRVSVGACLLLVVSVTPVLAAQAPPGLAAITTRVEAEAQRLLAETGTPAVSIALIRSGVVVWAQAFGFANVATRVAATPDTYFSTGSTFKLVTATAVMQLVETGRVSLDTPLNALVDSAPAIDGADDVTLRHLLSHHSGLTGPFDFVPLWSRKTLMSPEQILAATRREGPPGTEHRYCNECYAIASYVIERISGVPYDQYVAERVLRPLGIDISLATIPTPAMVERMALPYDVENGVSTPIEQVRFDVYAAGDAYLRPMDMAKLFAAHLGGGSYAGQRILKESSMIEMHRQQFESGRNGLGIDLAQLNGRAVIQHNGLIPGFNSIMIGDPETGHGVYVMANSGNSGRAVASLARLSLRLLWGEEPGAP